MGTAGRGYSLRRWFWGHHSVRRWRRQLPCFSGLSHAEGALPFTEANVKQTSYQMLIATLHFKRTNPEMKQKEYSHFPNLTDKLAPKKKNSSVWHTKVIYITYFWSTKPHDRFYQKWIKQNILYLQVSQTLKERLLRTEIKIVFLPTLYPGNKISHQNTLDWLILKSEEEDFSYKQVSPRLLSMRLLLICFCVVLWRFFFFFSKHKNQETDF